MKRVVALSIDQDGIGAVEAFYRELGVRNLGLYVDASGVAAVQLNVRGLPSTLLLDPRGRELGRIVGPVEWDGEIAIRAIRNALSGGADDSRSAHGGFQGTDGSLPATGANDASEAGAGPGRRD